MSKATGLISIFVLSVTAVLSNGFAEDIPNSTVLLLAKVVSNIYLQGYSGINKVEYDDDVYKVIVINKDSQEQYLYIDSATATVPTPKQSAKEINMSQAIADIPQDRCKTITSVEYYNGAYNSQISYDD